VKPLERLPCEPECDPHLAIAVLERLAPVREHLRAAFAAVVSPLHARLETVARRLDTLYAAVTENVRDRLSFVSENLHQIHRRVSDAALGTIGAVVARHGALIDLDRLEREAVQTAGALSPPDSAMPAPLMPRGEWRARPAPAVLASLYPSDPYGTPVISGVPDWIADIHGRFGIHPTGVANPEFSPVVSSVGADAPTAVAGAVSGPHGSDSLVTPGGPLSPEGSGPFGPPQYAAAPLSGAQSAGSPLWLGEVSGHSTPHGAAAPLVAFVRAEIDRAFAAIHARDARGVPETGGRSASDEPAAGAVQAGDAGQVCPPVHVHVHCAPGVTAEQGDAPGDVFLIGADTNGDGHSDEMARAAMRDPRRGRAAVPPVSPELRREQLRELEARAATGPGVLDTAGDVLAWVERYRKVISGAADQPSCAAGGKELAEIVGGLEAMWLWLTGTKDGRGWDRSGGLPAAIAGLPPVISGAAEALARGALTLVRQQLNAHEYLTGCDNPGVIPLVLLRGLVGVVEGWAKVPLPEARAKLDQAVGVACAAGIPTIGEATVAFLTGRITKDSWRCLVRANGGRDEWFDPIMESQQTLPSPLQITNVAMRIGATDDQLRASLRKVGVFDPAVVTWFKSLAEYVPSPTDLVSFMLRDVFDKDVVAKYGYDEQFKDKYQGQVIAWARSQGMQEETFRKYWHAHWRLPSPTQGFEFLHRLRPGRVPEELKTDANDVIALLNVNDYPTYWAKRLAAVSYKPLTRVDTRRAYFLGALSEDETREAILDLGYGADNADLLLRYWRFERVEWILRRPFAREYVAGTLSDAALDEEMLRLRLTEVQVSALRAALGARAASATRVRTLGNIRRRVVTGLTAGADAAAELRALGYSAERAGAMTDGWEEERASKGRVITASQLCKMYAGGLIGGDTYTTGMLRLGYSLDDSRRMISLCEIDKKLEPSARGVQGEDAERAARHRERAEQITAARKRNMEVARAARKQRGLPAAEEKVLKKLGTVAGYLAKGYGGYPPDYSGVLAKWHERLVDGACYSRQGAADLIYTIVVPMAQRKLPDWQRVAQDYFDSVPPQPCPAGQPDRELLPLPLSQPNVDAGKP
jgi:hypothetical protein